jgi:hypothetical protein
LASSDDDRLRMLEARVLKKKFEPNREESPEKQKELRNKEFHDRHSSPNIWVIKKTMKWAEHVAYIGDRRGIRGSLKGRDHLEDLDVHWTVILKWILNTMGGC